MKTYILTLKAEEDIRSIWKYTAEKWDEIQAEIYLSGLEDKIKQAAKSPDTIGLVRDELKKGYMSFLFEHHIIFFKKKTGHIEVIRILHQRMDITERLK